MAFTTYHFLTIFGSYYPNKILNIFTQKHFYIDDLRKPVLLIDLNFI